MFNTIKNLYTRKDFAWIQEVDEAVPVVPLYNYLLSDPNVGMRIKGLNKYLFEVDPKTFVALLHTQIPKKSKAPYLEGVLKNEEDEDKTVVMDKIRRYFKYSEREFGYIREYLYTNVVLKEGVKVWKIKLGIGGKNVSR